MFSKTGAEAYFNAEKTGSLVILLVGLFAIGLSITLLFIYRNSFTRGLAMPLILIALLELIAGFTVYSRSDKQRVEVVYNMDMNPDVIRDKELPRMQQVMKSLVVYRYMEICFLITGAGLFLYFRKDGQHPFWAGAGIGLVLQAVTLLVLDGVAEKRGNLYLDGLQSFIQLKNKRHF